MKKKYYILGCVIQKIKNTWYIYKKNNYDVFLTRPDIETLLNFINK